MFKHFFQGVPSHATRFQIEQRYVCCYRLRDSLDDISPALLRIDAPGPSLRIIELAVNLRSRVLKLPYGDQAIFVRTEIFHELGGFAEMPVMEDFEFVRRLCRRGNIRILPLPVSTSARRWRELGPWHTTWINQKIIMGYYLGVSHQRLATCYARRVK